MSEEKRVPVQLTEREISALIVTVGDVKCGAVHPCRIKEVHNALTELRETRRELQIARGD